MSQETGREFTISVVEVDGEKLFSYEGLLFDQVDADPFDGGTLRILRNGDVFDKTTRICEQGTHAACTCFVGLRKVRASNGLIPDELQVGDILKIETPRELNYAQYLRFMAAYIPALTKTLSEKPGGMSLGELDEKLPDKVAEEWSHTKDATILRFYT